MTVRIAINKDAASAAPVKKAQRLSKIEVYEVSLVTTPAVPDATIAIMKSMDSVPAEKQYHREVGILKIDKVKKQIYAYALVPDKEDLQGDICTKEDVEGAKDSFFKNLSARNQKGTGIGGQHQVFEGIGYPIGGDIDIDGSYGRMIGIPADKCIPGGWLLGIQVIDDDVWARVEKGEITGVSIGCIGDRTEIKTAAAKAITEDQRGAIRKWIDGFLKERGYVRALPVDKAIDFNSSYTMQIFYDECPDMWDSLMSAFWSIMYDDSNLPTFESKMAAIEESLTQFAVKIRTLFGIEKSKAVIEFITNKATGDTAGENEGVLDMQITQEQLDKLIGEAVTKALTPINEKLASIDTEIKKIAEIEKSAAKIEKLEETDFAKGVAKSLEELGAVIDGVATNVFGSNVRKDDGAPPEKKEPTLAEKQAAAPTILASAKTN